MDNRRATSPRSGFVQHGAQPPFGRWTLRDKAAQRVARHLRCAYLRIDTIEQGLRELLSANVEGEGYRLAYKIASDNCFVKFSTVLEARLQSGLLTKKQTKPWWKTW